MPGISLDYLCRDRAPSATVETLAGTVLGIEADHYLRKLIQQSRSPLYTPWSGVSPAIYKTFEADFEALERHMIQPFFIFSGLQVSQQSSLDPNVRLLARQNAMGNMEKRRNDETVSAFANLTNASDLTQALKDYLRQNNRNFMVAPYFAGAQLTYMLNCGVLDSIYGPADVLIFGAERVITDMNFHSSARFTFCDKAVILGTQLSNITEEQFLDAFLFAGNEFCPLVPILEQNPPSEYSSFRIRAAADVVRQNGTGFLALNDNPLLEKRPNYMEDWLRARSLFRHHPYMNQAGEVVLLNEESAPNDTTKIFGPRLPRELYFYLSRGVINPPMINSLISGVWRENMPMEGGDTKEFRALLDGIHEARVQSFELLHGSKLLHNYLEKKTVASHRWYARGHQEDYERFESPLIEDLARWKVNAAFVQKYSGQTEVTLTSVLLALQTPEAISASFRFTEQLLCTRADLDACVFCRLLHLRGYLNSAHELTDWGEALFAALQGSEQTLNIPILVSIEMLKLRVLKFEEYTSRVPSAQSPEAILDNSWNIIARLGALQKLRQSDAPWQGPIDRDALTAHAIARTTSDSLGNLFEMLQLTSLMRGNFQRVGPVDDVFSRASNPFTADHDAGLATYAKRSLEGMASIDGTLSEHLLNRMQNQFPTAIDARADLERVFMIWEALVRGTHTAARSKLMGTLEEMKFQASDNWLKDKRSKTS